MGLSFSCLAQQTELDQLKKINARFIHNFVTNDVTSHDQLIHPRFICITSQGAWVTREEYLKAWANGFDPDVIVYWDYRDEKITVIGNTALVRSVNKYIIRKDGKETTGMSQYTDTYVKEDGRWQCIQAQITPVSPANFPPDETIVKKYLKGKVM
jgi:ketosteroid isomerase-like protein